MKFRTCLPAEQILYWTDPSYRALCDLEHGISRYLHGFNWPDYLRLANRGAYKEIHRRGEELRKELEGK